MNRRKVFLLTVAMFVLILGLGIWTQAADDTDTPKSTETEGDETQTAIATFAGGCFWCMEPPFDKIDGVLATTSGYIGGHKKNPTYKEVSAGRTGHTEAVQVRYDPDRVPYEALLAIFWVNIDRPSKIANSVTGAVNIEPASSITTKRSIRPLCYTSRRSTKPNPFPSRSSPRSSPPERSIPPRNIIRTTTKRTQSTTKGIARAADAISG